MLLAHQRRRLAAVLAAVLSATTAVAQTQHDSDGRVPITTHSDTARALFLRARALNETLKPHEAHDLFARAVTLDPSFALAEYYLASTSPTPKELAEHLEKAVALAPRASAGERLIILGMQARTHADRALARQLAESLVTLYPRDERAHFILATVYSAQQQYPKVIAEYRAAIAINPEYSLAYNQIGYAYRSTGDLAAAEGAFKKYVSLMPNDPNPHDSYAELLMKLGRFDESIAQYRQALAADPSFGASHVGMAADEMFLGHHAAAVASLENYYRRARDDGERRTALLTEAMVEVDRHATDAALGAMTRSFGVAVASADTSSMAADASTMGDILLEAGRVDAASAKFQQAHDLVAKSSLPAAAKDDDALARHYDLARLALARHDLMTARGEATAYATGAAAHRNDLRIRQSHELDGRIALDAKEFDVSLAALASADQESAAVWYAMARAYAGKGDLAKAKDLSMRAMHLNDLPTFPYVFTRASLAAATGSATSETARGRPR
jgi:tetratricopeptide (TPR) repeat protein